MNLTTDQVTHWQGLLEQQRGDADWMHVRNGMDRRRIVIIPEIQGLLRKFLSGEVSVADLKTTFDTKTRTDWEGFGFKGMSGAMFLNMLVKHIDNEALLTAVLKKAIVIPKTEADARSQMSDFLRYLEGLIKSGQVAKRQLQPARLPFLVSGWWHIQDIETWPIYYISARQAMQREGLYVPDSNPVEDYFRFRSAFLTAAKALNLRTWEFEHLCAWCDRKHGPPDKLSVPRQTPVPRTVPDDDPDPPVLPASELSHTQVQYLLADLGHHFGCKVWIASNDQSKVWEGKQLGQLSLAKLPNLGMGIESQRIINLIDVLWLKGSNQVAAAFEIEHSTSVYSGLLRMCDLTVLAPNLLFPLYIVAPEERLDKVRRELERPSFQTLELHNRCSFFSSERLLSETGNMKKWANDPSALEKLAEHVADVLEDQAV